MAAIENDGYYEAYWPRAARKGRPRAPARRLGTLKGKTIAQLWTLGFRGDQLFTALEEGLSRRYPGIRFISWKEFGNIHGPDEREIVAGHGGGDRRIEAAAEKRHGEELGGQERAHQRRQHGMGIADIGHIGMAHAVEGGGGEDQDRGIAGTGFEVGQVALGHTRVMGHGPAGQATSGSDGAHPLPQSREKRVSGVVVRGIHTCTLIQKSG